MNRRLQLVLILLLLNGPLVVAPGAWAPAGAEDQDGSDALIVLESTDLVSMQRAVSLIEDSGGRIVHIFPTHILIGEIPHEIEPLLLGQAGIVAIHRTTIDPVSVEEYGEMATLGVEAWNHLLEPPPIEERKPPTPLVDDALYPPVPPPEVLATQVTLARPYGATEWDTSEYMIGSVTIGIIFVESNGAIDPNTEDWTTAETDTMVSKITTAMDWWATWRTNLGLTSAPGLSFTYIPQGLVGTSYEPINRPGSWEEDGECIWAREVYANLGWSTVTGQGNCMDMNVSGKEYADALREANGTDWAFAILLVDSSSDADGKFLDGKFAWAYFGGPHTTVTYDSGDWGSDRTDFVFAHETGHVFYALDEYYAAYPDADGCYDRSGYLDIANTNYDNPPTAGSPIPPCVHDDDSSIMRGRKQTLAEHTLLIPPAREMVGWGDSDGDGIEDILDTEPDTSLVIYSPDPTSDDTPTYTGSANVTLYPNSNPNLGSGGNDINVDTIAGVEYRVDGGGWIAASAVDGAFDESVEDFTFTTAPLPDGTHTVEVRAINGVGNVETSYGSDTITIVITIGPLKVYLPMVFKNR